jgi:hypothetical protein
MRIAGSVRRKSRFPRFESAAIGVGPRRIHGWSRRACTRRSAFDESAGRLCDTRRRNGDLSSQRRGCAKMMLQSEPERRSSVDQRSASRASSALRNRIGVLSGVEGALRSWLSRRAGRSPERILRWRNRRLHRAHRLHPVARGFVVRYPWDLGPRSINVRTIALLPKAAPATGTRPFPHLRQRQTHLRC